MIIAIQLLSGGIYYTKAESILEVKKLIEDELDPGVVVFWYSAMGKRYEETMYVDMSDVKYLMTESDHAPWENG